MRIRQLIFTLKITQTAFAQHIGVSRGYVNEVLHGKCGTGVDFIQGVAKAYKNISLRWLIMGEGDMYELATVYEQTPPELESGQSDKVEEGVRIEYLKKEGQLESMARRLEDHERRLRDLEGRE